MAHLAPSNIFADVCLIALQSHLAVLEFREPDFPLGQIDSVAGMKLYIKAPVEPENKGIWIRMIP